MSRALDLFLVIAVALVAWKLIRYQPGGADAAAPITTTVKVRGDVSLVGLGLLLRPTEGNAAMVLVDSDTLDDIAPHQLSPWQANRRTQIRVPGPGSYTVRWGAQESAPPRRAREVLKELSQDAKFDDQVIVIEADATVRDTILLDLPEAHAEGIRALGESEPR